MSSESSDAKQVFKNDATLFILKGNEWIKIGNGKSILIDNIHNPTKFILKYIASTNDNNNDDDMFQIDPKIKQKGTNSWVMKATVKL